MHSSDQNTPKDISEPIDVEFKPADPDDLTRIDTEALISDSLSKPGWTALITASLVSAMTGGAIGVIANGTNGTNIAKFAPAEVALDIARLSDSHNEISEQLERLKGNLYERSALQDSKNTETLETFEMVNVDLERLRDNLTALQSRLYPKVEKDTPQAVAEDVEVESEQTTPSTRPILGDLPDIPSLVARLEALENPDILAVNMSTRDVITSLNNLHERFETIENAWSKVSSMSYDIDNLRSEVNNLGAAQLESFNAQEDAQKIIADWQIKLESFEVKMQEEVERIESSINILQSSIKTLSTSPDVTNSLIYPKDEGDWPVFFLNLKQAVRLGRPFLDILPELEEVLPEDKDVAILARFADGKSGLVSWQALSDALAKTVQDIPPAATRPLVKNDGWTWLRNAFSGLVGPRKSDLQDPAMQAEFYAGIDIIRIQIANGTYSDLPDQVANTIPQAFRPFLEEWQVALQYRLDCDRALERIAQKLIK